MAGGIDPDAQLDYAEFELFQSQNRYEVCICSGKKVETIESGLLEQLLLHSTSVQNLNSKRLNASFKIHLPNANSGAAWFTKSILTRFLRIVGSPDILDISKNFENEISHLEETRKFQLSMNEILNSSSLTDEGRLNSTKRAAKAEVDFVSSDASKNELLRAMDLRLTALRDELVAAFCKATGTSCSSKEITDLQTFSHYFGAMNIRNSLRKFIELSQVGQVVDVPDGEKFLFTNNPRNEKTNNTNENVQTSRSSTLDTPVKYGVSPAKVAQLERQSSTEESSVSSEDDQPSVERSRPVVRSATPRRSASPMRRVQIGRSGSRRASAVAIKSLNHFSGRERLLSQIEAANSDEEEISKPAVVKKTSSKASLPATRKSWPSTPLPRTVGTSPAKTPAGTSSTGTAPKRAKPQPVSSLPRSSPNMERLKPNLKTVKGPQFDSNKNVKGMNDKQQQTTKSEKITKTKTKTQTPSAVHSSTAKPSLYNKVTKKSSVVPLESKPFLRKGSRVAAGVSPVIKTKVSSPPEESMKDSKDVIKAEESELVASSLSPVCVEDTVDGMEIHSDKEPESQSITVEKCEDAESSNQVIACFDDNAESFAESILKTGDEEVSVISPAAWVEMEEYQDESIMYDDRSTETAATVAAVKVTSPRVRHSLSQMLLEETSECDTAEWGNAENPPTMVHQKDAPKGLKRLLKFARKSKLDASSGWSSPSGFSEGEDEAEESKTSKKNAENLLRKAALNAKNYGPQRSDSYESYEKYTVPQSGVNNLNNERANKLQESHTAASVTTSKATRSFFSLSAFKGSKT
uniref:COP1-interacting protein 7 n=1 Tax=Daucus carota subsp. sativus TaxID=79200 RepID=A0A164WZB6_DAUCS